MMQFLQFDGIYVAPVLVHSLSLRSGCACAVRLLPRDPMLCRFPITIVTSELFELQACSMCCTKPGSYILSSL